MSLTQGNFLYLCWSSFYNRLSLSSFLRMRRGERRRMERVKLTLLCGLLTFVMLAGQIFDPATSRDAGTSNAVPETTMADQAYLDQLSRLFGRKQRQVLPEKASLTASGNPRYFTIVDWDEQRLNHVTKKSSGTGDGLILMVTGSQALACEGKEGDHLLLRSAKNKMDYCRIHGIELYYNMALLEPDMGGFWTKLPLLRSLMVARPDVEWLWWMDSDAVFTDMAFPLPMLNYNNSNLVLPGNPTHVYNDTNWLGLNTGSFLIRNCQWSLDLISAWSPIKWNTTTKKHAGHLLSKSLTGRPNFEADDQSALIYLLASERDIWSNKVYFENSYILHGFWSFIVDRYEEMVHKNENLPLVTHFVGCKPCDRYPSDYPAEKCQHGMERALNFADNQIIKSFGFQHNDLSTHVLTRISQNHIPKL